MLGGHRHKHRVDYFLHNITLIILLEDLFEIYVLILKKATWVWVSSRIHVDSTSTSVIPGSRHR